MVGIEVEQQKEKYSLKEPANLPETSNNEFKGLEQIKKHFSEIYLKQARVCLIIDTMAVMAQIF